MPGTARGQHGANQRTLSAFLHPSGPAASSLITPPLAGPSARQFCDAQSGAWRVHLVRAGVERDVTRHGPPRPAALRFQNAAGSRYLRPVPADWLECDDAALCRYCLQAEP